MKVSLTNTTILVVENDAAACELLRTILETSGACVAVAQSVEGAMEVFRRCPPHAIVTDIRLGNSDGYALLEAVRRYNAEYRGFTPVLAVTGFASDEDRRRALGAGFGGYLSKPFVPDDVVDALARLLKGPAALAA